MQAPYIKFHYISAKVTSAIRSGRHEHNNIVLSLSYDPETKHVKILQTIYVVTKF